MNTNSLPRKIAASSFALRAGVTLSLALVALAGCQSMNQPVSDQVASVTIQNRATAEIGAAVMSVFTQAGYQGGPLGRSQYVFTRPGSLINDAMYGDWVSSRKTQVRVTVNVAAKDNTSTLVSCKAEIIQAPGEAVFQDTYKVRKLGSGPYQSLLNEVQAKLQ